MPFTREGQTEAGLYPTQYMLLSSTRYILCSFFFTTVDLGNGALIIRRTGCTPSCSLLWCSNPIKQKEVHAQAAIEQRSPPMYCLLKWLKMQRGCRIWE
jgi:hypothetical protein